MNGTNRVWLGIPLLLLVITACAGKESPPDGRTPAPQGETREGPATSADTILFAASGDLFTIRSDGSCLKQITQLSEELQALAPAWSPDGRKIAFVSVRKAVRSVVQFFVINADGSGLQALTQTLSASEGFYGPAWSPDGARLVFSVNSGRPEVNVVNSDGTGLMRLSDGDWPAWSPDGQHIVFVFGQIYVMNADATSPIRLTTQEGTSISEIVTKRMPAWSPNGTRIAYLCGRLFSQICIMGADGSEQRVLTDFGCNCGSIGWSPDGTRILYAGAFGIYVVKADGSSPLRLADGFSPAWSPDGNRITFLVDTGGAPFSDIDVYVINADGTGEKRLTDLPLPFGSIGPTWAPRQR
jgi:TolB protein